MGAVIIALRKSDHTTLKRLAKERDIPERDLAGILLEEAIRRVLSPDSPPPLDPPGGQT